MFESTKKEIVEIAKRAQVEGLCKHKSGNFSVRDKETGLIVITPSAVDRTFLSPRDMIVMDLDYNVIENESNLKPSSECLVHIEIYKRHEHIDSVVHTHSQYATAFAVLNKPIPAIVYEIAHLGLRGTEVPVAPYGRPATMTLATNIAETMDKADVVLMEGHGAIVGAENIQEAYLKADYLEDLAFIYHIALVTNNHVEPPVFELNELADWDYPSQIKFK